MSAVLLQENLAVFHMQPEIVVLTGFSGPLFDAAGLHGRLYNYRKK